MNARLLGLSVALLMALSAPLAAGEPSTPAKSIPAKSPSLEGLPSLESVKWAGSPTTFDHLRGKTVVVLVYATWCPICNGWSGELFSQLKEAIKDKPVVVLAINVDKSATNVKSYLTERNFFAPNVLHGYDPSMVQRLDFETDLFQYVLIGPDGKLGKSGDGGSFYPAGKAKNFVLPTELKRTKNLGRFEVLSPEMSDALKQVFWPMELGTFSEKSLSESQKTLASADRDSFDAALKKYLDAKLERIRTLAKGTVPERFEAVEQASLLGTTFKSKEQGKQARALVATLSKDKDFQRELSAKKAYEKLLQSAAAKPNRREQFLESFCDARFEGTHYAEVAKEAMSHAPSKAGGG